jgi:hypothetical protein
MGIRLSPLLKALLVLFGCVFLIYFVANLLGFPLAESEAWNGEKSVDRWVDEDRPLLELLSTWFIRIIVFGGFLVFVIGAIFSVTRVGTNIFGQDPFSTAVLIKGTLGALGWGLMAVLFGVILYGHFRGSPFDSFMDGKWHGRYQCGDIHKVWLDVDQDDSHLFAVFRFETADGKKGKFEMRGSYNPAQQFTLNGYRWLDRPDGMEMINIEGQVNDARDHLDGIIKRSGCSAIIMDRTD